MSNYDSPEGADLYEALYRLCRWQGDDKECAVCGAPALIRGVHYCRDLECLYAMGWCEKSTCQSDTSFNDLLVREPSP